MPTVRYTVIDGEVIAEKRNGVRRLYVPDPLGSTVALVDNTQTITDRFGYWPYGEEASRTGTTPTPFRFVGTQGYHRDTPNRTYVRARVLRTDVGRWLMADPIGFAAGDENLFRYVRNRAVAAADPGGLGPCQDQYRACVSRARLTYGWCMRATESAYAACLANCASWNYLCRLGCYTTRGTEMNVCAAVLGAQVLACDAALAKCLALGPPAPGRPGPPPARPPVRPAPGRPCTPGGDDDEPDGSDELDCLTQAQLLCDWITDRVKYSACVSFVWMICEWLKRTHPDEPAVLRARRRL